MEGQVQRQDRVQRYCYIRADIGVTGHSRVQKVNDGGTELEGQQRRDRVQREMPEGL